MCAVQDTRVSLICAVGCVHMQMYTFCITYMRDLINDSAVSEIFREKLEPLSGK